MLGVALQEAGLDGLEARPQGIERCQHGLARRLRHGLKAPAVLRVQLAVGLLPAALHACPTLRGKLARTAAERLRLLPAGDVRRPRPNLTQDVGCRGPGTTGNFLRDVLQQRGGALGNKPYRSGGIVARRRLGLLISLCWSWGLWCAPRLRQGLAFLCGGLRLCHAPGLLRGSQGGGLCGSFGSLGGLLQPRQSGLRLEQFLPEGNQALFGLPLLLGQLPHAAPWRLCKSELRGHALELFLVHNQPREHAEGEEREGRSPRRHGR
mmetsp:Transcript_73440/g.219241  ORF Transcript_73440/g.219241 Transcript_73440/m.219241 type:complete len:265 (-) Transcript_73440:79-873(-)